MILGGLWVKENGHFRKSFYLSSSKLPLTCSALLPVPTLFQAGNRAHLTKFSSSNDTQFWVVCVTWFLSFISICHLGECNKKKLIAGLVAVWLRQWWNKWSCLHLFLTAGDLFTCLLHELNYQFPILCSEGILFVFRLSVCCPVIGRTNMMLLKSTCVQIALLQVSVWWPEP